MSPKTSNPFIVIESLDAGGGSTQAALLADALKERKYRTLSLHFPQAEEPTGQIIYGKFLKAKNSFKFSRREQALLYIQDFFAGAKTIEQHLAQTKKSALVSDRFYGSTLAYQTIGLTGKQRQAMLTWITSLCEGKAPRLPQPNLTVVLDLPVAISLQRLASRQQDYFENKQKLTAIRASYLKVARERGWVIIEGVDDKGIERPKQGIHEEIWSYVEKLLAGKR